MPVRSRGRGSVARIKNDLRARYRQRTGAVGRVVALEPLERRTLLSSGDLDVTFGVGGKVTTDFLGSAGDRSRQSAMQSDGKVVQVAWHGGFGSSEPTMAVARFNTDGSIDHTFGTDGLVPVDFPGRGEFFGSIAVGPDDRIAVAAWSVYPSTDLLGSDSDVSVALLHPDGGLDTAFDGDGMKVFDVGRAAGGPSAAPTADLVFDIAVQGDGKVVTAGVVTIDNQARFALTRLNTNGTLDTTFNSDGVVTTPFANYIAVASALDVDAAGRIVVVGEAGIPTGTPPRVTRNEFAVARYNPDGSLDTTFDGDGWAVTSVGTVDDGAQNVEVAPDGKIVVAGGSSSAVTGNDFAVVRYNPGGSLDGTFGVGGKATASHKVRNNQGVLVEANEEAIGLVVQPDGAVVVCGRSGIGVAQSNRESVILRFDNAGTLDSGFGDNGKVVPADMDDVNALLIQSGDGYVLVGGQVTTPTGGFEEFALLRLDPFGTPDGSFGPDGTGISTADFLATGFNSAAGAAMQADGKIVIGGLLIPNGSNRDLAFARYNPDGSLDETFGAGGRVQIDLGPDVVERVSAVAIDADGRVVFGGIANDLASNTDDVLVGRLNPDGSLDGSFAFGTGILRIGAIFSNPAAEEAARDLLVQPDGRIVLVGDYSVTAASHEFLVVRLEADGNFDTSFGPDFIGALHVPVSGIDSWANAVTLATDQDGDGWDLVLAGRARVGSADQFALIRLNDDGSLDGGFGAGGKATAPMTGASSAVANDVIVDSEGRILAGGVARGSSTRDDFAVMRFTPSGALDVTFDGDGRVMTDFDADNDAVNSLVVLADGAILAGGLATANFGLARYGPDGALDTSFATAGRARTDFVVDYYPGAPVVSRDEGVELFALPGDRAVMAGNASLPVTGPDFALARYVLTGPPNAVPVADAGGPYTMEEGTAGPGLIISAARSADPDGRIVRYEWDLSYEQFIGFNVEARGEQVTVPPQADESPTTRRVALRVTDDDGASHLVVATVTVVNVAPAVNAGPDQEVPTGAHFARIGSFADPGADTWTATVDYGAGAVPLALAADKTFSLAHDYPDPGTYTITITVRDNDGGVGTDTVVVTVGAKPAVVGRHVFYNHSSFDGNDATAGPSDDGAIAADKAALLPGQAGSFANVTGYSRGINGLMIDVNGNLPMTALAALAGSIGLRAGTGGDASGWAEAVRPSQVAIRQGAGVNGSDRLTLIWPDGTIRNTWLHVTVPVLPQFGLAAPDVFYFGNLIGETGGANALAVDVLDLARTRGSTGTTAPTSIGRFDLDRDGVVNAADVILVRNNQRRSLPLLQAPAANPVSMAAETPLSAAGRSAARRRRVWEQITAPDPVGPSGPAAPSTPRPLPPGLVG